MSTPTSTPETSITLRLTQEQKEKLSQAATMRCLSLSEYLLELALNAATEEIPEAEKIVLSERDWEIFREAMENPPEPNEALKAALKEHQEKSGKW
jgi:uncharacterized protein (DUF1778 family)